MKTKVFKFAGLLICTATFLACSDSNDSFVSNVNDIGENFIGEKYPIVLNGSIQSMTIYRFDSENRCVVDEDNE